MSRLAAYRWIAQPPAADGPPLPAIVTQLSMKSVGSAGSGSGSQRSWFGGTSMSKRLTMRPSPMRRNGPCIAAGRIRYSQLRRLCARGAVNAVPDSCSAYSPYGGRCGELRCAGSAPGSASVANSLPKPPRYSGPALVLTFPFTLPPVVDLSTM
jgi:hypothetical protein